MNVDNPQSIKQCSFTLRVMLRYQAPLRCIFIWVSVIWHFQSLFPVFLCLFVIGCRCLRGIDIRLFRCKARSWAQKVWSLQALLFSVLSIVSKIPGFWATAIEVYFYKLFAVNVTLEVADFNDLITRLKLVRLSTIREFFLERRG